VDPCDWTAAPAESLNGRALGGAPRDLIPTSVPILCLGRAFYRYTKASDVGAKDRICVNSEHSASIFGGGCQMDTSTIEREAKVARDDAMKLTAPLQTFWKMTFFDMPLAVASESMRFFGSRLQAHGDHLASLNSCRSVPEILDMQSHFVRHTVDVYGQETSKIIKDVRSTANEVQNQMSKAA
jgi:hypothetical protein